MFGRKTKVVDELVTCSRCGVAYDARYVQEPYRHLCPEHRKEPMETDRKKSEVKRWAERNYEKLYEQAKSENAAWEQSTAAANIALMAAWQPFPQQGCVNPYNMGQAQMGPFETIFRLLR